MQFGTCWGTPWELSEHAEDTLRTWWEHSWNKTIIWSFQVWIAVSSIGPSESNLSNNNIWCLHRLTSKVAVFKYANKVAAFKYASTHSRPWRRHADWLPPPQPPKWTNENPTTSEKTATLVGFTILHQQSKPKAGVTNLSTTAHWARCRYVLALTASCRSKYREFALVIKSERKHRRVQVWARRSMGWRQSCSGS